MFKGLAGLIGLSAAALLATALPGAAQQKVTLNVISAGDENMVDYVKDYLGPLFEKAGSDGGPARILLVHHFPSWEIERADRDKHKRASAALGAGKDERR